MPGGAPGNESAKSVRSKVTKVYGPMTEKNQGKFEKKLAGAQARNKSRNRAHLESKRSAHRAISQGMVVTRKSG